MRTRYNFSFTVIRLDSLVKARNESTTCGDDKHCDAGSINTLNASILVDFSLIINSWHRTIRFNRLENSFNSFSSENFLEADKLVSVTLICLSRAGSVVVVRNVSTLGVCSKKIRNNLFRFQNRNNSASFRRDS